MTNTFAGRSSNAESASWVRALQRLYARNPSIVIAPAMFTAFLVAWEVYVDTSGISDLVLPPPTKIVLALRDGIASGLLPRTGSRR